MTNHTLSAEELGLERAEFEAVLCDRYGYTPASIVSRRAGVGYNDPSLCMALVMWQARAALARQPQPERGEVLEVRGLQWLDTGHYRKKPPQFGYNPHDWNELCLVADAQRQIAEHKRLLAERDARIEALTEYAAAVERSADKAEQERDQLRARVAELEAKLAAPSFYWHDDENGAVESPEEWAEMQYGMTGEAFDSATLRCAIELPEREYDSIEFDAEGNCISIRYVGEVKAQPSGGKES